jgi:hypothetical protein
MCKKVAFILLYIGMVCGVFGKDFSVQERVWLFKIVTETQTLNQNWGAFFDFKEEMPTREVRVLRPGAKTYEVKIQWDVIEEKVLSDSSLLSINYEAIANTSPGLIAEAAVKLSLWELYSALKSGFQEQPPFSVNTRGKYFYEQMMKQLPAFMQQGREVRKKYISHFYDLLNPSLPLMQKSVSLAQIRKLDIQGQKSILDKWHQLVQDYVDENSLAYFNELGEPKSFFTGKLLAVGEGSGSSGLLNEFEKPGDDFLDTGTGKGIGLFTYDMVKKRNQLVPKFTSRYKIQTSVSEPTCVHFALWGMDSNKKPLIVIKHKEKSYLLFGHYSTKQISPNDKDSEGISYLDRITEFEQLKINSPQEELHKKNGLIAIIQREEQIREALQNQARNFEVELDSLYKLEKASEEAISIRETKLNTLLINLRKKENRITELQRKISAEYKKIESAQKRLDVMKSMLGKHVQSFVREDSIYTFSDGTIFNAVTQDLIIYGEVGDDIAVQLLAASFSLESERKDEVQLYINVMGSATHAINKEPAYISDSLIASYSIYFKPDEYICSDDTLKHVIELVNKLNIKEQAGKEQVKISLWANGVDTVQITKDISGSDKMRYTRQFSCDYIAFKQARRVDIRILKMQAGYHLIIDGFTDVIPSHLSKNSREQQVVLDKFNSKSFSQNPVLSALRIFYVVQKIEKYAGIDFSDSTIEINPLQVSISYVELKTMLNQ